MGKAYSVLEGTQEDINRRLLRRIMALEKKEHIDSTIYSFISYDSNNEKLGEGTVKSTGIVQGKYVQMEVLTNDVAGFVGQKFYVIQTAKPDGKTKYALYSDAGKTNTGMKVTITEQ